MLCIRKMTSRNENTLALPERLKECKEEKENKNKDKSMIPEPEVGKGWSTTQHSWNGNSFIRPSQELSFDVTADEDFIPPSQPQSTESSKISKNSDVSFSKSIKKLECTDTISDSNIVETPPSKAVIDQSTLEWDESTDFIPETETKSTEISHPIEDFSCKKKLLVFNSGDIFKNQSNPTWNVDVSKISESPTLDTLNYSILNDSSAKVPSNQETVTKVEESVTEIIVNDSAETVDLEATPVKIKKSESGRAGGESEISCSLNYDAEKCEETQIFDNSSVLLLGQPETASDLEKNEINGVTSEKLYLQQTTDDNEAISQKELKGFNLGFGLPVAELTEKSDIKKDAADIHRPEENSLFKKEVPQNPLNMETDTTSIVTRKVDFKLTVSCFVTINTKTNKVLQKIISKVHEIPKSKPKPVYVEHTSDTTSDKSKRYSTSSSGSVYSDKMGLPFALPPPKRVSAISDLTDSSEEEFGMLCKEGKRALERIPWSNEYLLPLKMDDMMQISIENEELLKRPMISSPRKPKNKPCDGGSHLKEILESSSSEQTSFCNLDTQELRNLKVLGKKTSGNSETLFTEEIKQAKRDAMRSERDTDINESEQSKEEKKKHMSSEPVIQELNIELEAKQLDSAQKIRQIEGQISLEEESTSITLCDGLPVFARWTDKLYYSGVLSGNMKNNRWEVKFDDGTSKVVREDFIMPSEWLKSGALVFVLTGDKCESGQILNIKKGDEINYVVELDSKRKEVSVKISDLCLTDVMAGIIREKYKPLVGTPKSKADIDFDNVISGKRLREQKTPLKTPFAVPTANSGAKKKSSSKIKKAKEPDLEPLNEVSSNKKFRPTGGGLKSENGHLLEDKIISADSPSGNEAVETPLRGKPKEPRGKAKPRSLSYESEETRLNKNWLAPDGTPIPGPSGVKLKKQKTIAKTKESEIPVSKDKSPSAATRSSKKRHAHSEASQLAERSRRKRKLNESVEGSIQKKSLKEGNGRVKRKIKKL